MKYYGWEMPPRKKQPEEDSVPMVRGIPFSMYANYLKQIPTFLTRRQKELTDFWLEIGHQDPLLKRAVNPPFDLGRSIY